MTLHALHTNEAMHIESQHEHSPEVMDYAEFLATGKIPPSPEFYHAFIDPELATRFPLVKETYDRSICVVINTQHDEFGGLLNMTRFPMVVNGITFRSVEHLYQTLRYPMCPDLQKRIIETPSPLIMKRMLKPHRIEGRPDWYQDKIKVMNYCLHVKLAFHYNTFGKLLDATGDRTIVETSPDGDFWGGLPIDKADPSSPLVGVNVFGKLLMDLRSEYRQKSREELMVVEPLHIPDFLLFGQPVEHVDNTEMAKPALSCHTPDEVSEKADPLTPAVTIFSASFPELVDLVLDSNNTVTFLVNDGTQLKICRYYASGDIMYVPPPVDKIPFTLPRASEAVKHYEMQQKDPVKANSELIEDIIAELKAAVDMPNDKYYLLIAAWVLHTYLQEQVDYSPIISMVAFAECGKSRAGKSIIYQAYRGIHLESLRESHIIRFAENFHASMFFDVRDISKKIEMGQSEDVILGRFEKGVKVPRIDKKAIGNFVDTNFYSVFGPTIIASNREMDGILDSRAIRIPMVPTTKIFDHDIKPTDFLTLKERLVAFRARHMATKLPDVSKPTGGRLGDIVRPLYQVIKLVAPEREKEFLEVVKLIEEQRKAERALSSEAIIVSVVDRLRTASVNGTLSVLNITNSLNSNRPGYSAFTPQKVGRILNLLGFEKSRTSNGSAAIVVDENLINALKLKYNVE